MATKKKGLAKTHRRAKKIVKRSSAPKENPPLFTDLVEFIIPGFAGYAATRFTSRITRGMVEKRFPKLGKHAAVLSSLAAFGASWLLIHRVKKVAKYHTPATVGAAIAAMQTVVQTYFPKYGWIVSDYQEPKKLLAPPQVNNAVAPPGAKPITENFNLQPSVEEQMSSIEADLAQLESDEGVSSPVQSIGDDSDGIGDLLDDVGDDYSGLMGEMN